MSLLLFFSGQDAVTELTIQTTSLPDGVEGTAYSETITAAAGTPPYSWAVTSGNLPTGLTLSSGAGTVTGTPTVPSLFTFTVTVTDAALDTDDQVFNVTIVESGGGSGSVFSSRVIQGVSWRF